MPYFFTQRPPSGYYSGDFLEIGEYRGFGAFKVDVQMQDDGNGYQPANYMNPGKFTATWKDENVTITPGGSEVFPAESYRDAMEIAYEWIINVWMSQNKVSPQGTWFGYFENTFYITPREKLADMRILKPGFPSVDYAAKMIRYWYPDLIRWYDDQELNDLKEFIDLRWHGAAQSLQPKTDEEGEQTGGGLVTAGDIDKQVRENFVIQKDPLERPKRADSYNNDFWFIGIKDKFAQPLIGKTGSKHLVTAAAKGFAVGGTFGSAIPGVGTGIASAVGTVAGFIEGLFSQSDGRPIGEVLKEGFSDILKQALPGGKRAQVSGTGIFLINHPLTKKQVQDLVGDISGKFVNKIGGNPTDKQKIRNAIENIKLGGINDFYPLFAVKKDKTQQTTAADSSAEGNTGLIAGIILAILIISALILRS